MSPVNLNVFTLNCWTVPFSSQDISVRLEGIGKHLAISDYDVVFLQEVWTRKGYETVKKECASVFKYSRCFFSGRVGTSGLCIFSRYPILDTFYHPYMLNGYWYQVFHGDSHACKGVAFARIVVESIVVNCFVTHLHAEYDRLNDQYFSHRLAQTHELLKLADLISPSVSDNGSLTLIAGDLNMEPQDLGVRLLRAGGFIDSWQQNRGEEFGATCDLPSNCYSPSDSLKLWPAGRRIDYILYRAGKASCKLTNCSVQCLTVPAAGKSLPASDHEAVTATFALSSVANTGTTPSKPGPLRMRKLLVRHIRHCFIQGDESGQCEQALEETGRLGQSPPVALPDADEYKDALGDRVSHAKPGTATKVFYLTALKELSMSELLDGQSNSLVDDSKQKEADNLSDILASHFSNPFHRFSRFSAQMPGGAKSIALCPGVRTLTISIFLTSRVPEEGGPMIVHINMFAARIVDLVGLVLWQYYSDKREPALQDLELSHYALLSADDGEVDFGIPSFDPLEPLLKYGFSAMALVYVPMVFAKDKTGRPGMSSPRSGRILPTNLTVTLTHYNFGTHHFTIESKEVTLSQLIDMFLKKVAESPRFNNSSEILDKSNFTLEAESQSGRLCENLEMTIGRIGCCNFKVHRKHCNPSYDDKDKSGSLVGQSATDSKVHGQVFHVRVERTRNKPVEVELVVDTDVVYLNQKEPNTSRSMPKSIVRASIESCRLIGADVGVSAGGKQLVRIQVTYKTNDNTEKKLIMELAAQVAAVELVSLLQR